MKITTGIGAMLVTLGASFLLILLGLVFFIVTLWIVRIGSDFILGKGALNPNWAVLSAAIIAVGTIMASSMSALRQH